MPVNKYLEKIARRIKTPRKITEGAGRAIRDSAIGIAMEQAAEYQLTKLHSDQQPGLGTPDNGAGFLGRGNTR
jgi:hypothetical protein